MVNEELKREIKQLFLQGFESAFESESHAASIEIKEKRNLDEMEEGEFFVLTISSQLFRMFFLLHFSKSELSEQFVSDMLNLGATGVSDERFYDFLGELGNGMCGSLKRELNKSILSLGMSTPNRLDKDCLKYITALDVDLEYHACAEIDGEPLFYASAYLSADQPLDYKVSSALKQEDEADSGDLEFF